MNKTLPVDHDERMKAIDPTRSIIAIAPAGSGKTSVLVLRFLACMARCENPEEVLAITFTRKAAGEMQHRIVSALQKVESGVQPTSDYEALLIEKAKAVLEVDKARGWNILKNPARLRIYTIDKLNSLLANKLPLLSGMGGQGRIEENPELLYRDAVLSLFAEIEDDNVEPELRASLERVLQFSRYQVESLSPLLEQLLATRDQWLADVLNYDHSRSEAVLTTLIENVLVRASASFTQCQGATAVGALKAGSGCHEKLAWASALNGIPEPSVSNLKLWRQLAKALLTSSGTLKKRITIADGFEAKRGYTEAMKQWLSDRSEDTRTERLEQVLEEVSLLPDPQIPAAAIGFIEALQVVLLRLVSHLKVAFQHSGKVDFIEIAQRAIAALGDDENGYGDALLEEDRVKHILVDEKQDTSFSQFRLLECMMAGWEAGDDRSIFFCGDPQQSIYFWRGASVGLFVMLWESAQFGVKKLERVQLSTNFRSNQPMVDWFNSAFGQIFPKRSDIVTGAVAYSQAHGFSSDMDGGVYVHTSDASNDGDEAERVVELVKEALANDPKGTIAILVRGRSHLKSIIPALRAAGIQFTGQDIDKISDNAPISDCIGLIRAQWHLGDRVAWMTFLRSPLVGLSWADCLALSKGRKQAALRDVLDDYQNIAGLSEEGKARISRVLSVLRHIENSPRCDDLVWRTKALWHSLGGISAVDATEYQDVQRVFKLLATCCTGGQLESIYVFEKKLGSLFATPTAGKVEIMTIHKSKGLEFDTVILPGLHRRNASDSGQLMYWKTIQNAFLLAPQPLDEDEATDRLYSFMRSIRSQEQSHEMLRTLYVAATRARKTLHLLTGVSIKDDQLYVETNSFAAMLMPVIERSIVVPEDVAMGGVNLAGENGRDVLAPRLPANYSLPEERESYLPAWLKGEIPPETVLRTELGKDDDYENLAARVTGIVYHHFMHRISMDGLQNWSLDKVQASRKPIIALLRRCGCPEEEVSECVERVVKLLSNTLNSSTGRWLLAAREQSRSEFAVSGRNESEWYTVILDKTFKEDGKVWIVDYKSAALRGDKARFLSAEWGRYRAKMEKYRSALRLAGVKEPIVTALYYPDVDELVVDQSIDLAA